MTKIKNLLLEQRLQIRVKKLPFSKEVKAELSNKSVYVLGRLYDKFLKGIDPDGSMMCYLPGFTCEAYKESHYMLSALNMLPKENRVVPEEGPDKKFLDYSNREKTSQLF